MRTTFPFFYKPLINKFLLMALQAILNINGKSYNVQDLDYRIFQPSDSRGKPTAIAEGGIINFTILANNKDNFLFHRWVLSISDVESGEFLLPITNGIEHDTIILKFKDAFCTDLQVNYGSFNEKQLYMRISITPTKLIFGTGVEYINKKIAK